MEGVKKIIDEMLDEKSTCARCDFKVCPMLGLFAGKLQVEAKKAEAEFAKTVDNLNRRIGHLELALTKIMEYTENDKERKNVTGYVNRTATNALADLNVEA